MDFGDGNSSWREFAESQLLQSGLIDGVCLLSKLGVVLYSYGKLADILQTDSTQFLLHFGCVNYEKAKALQEKGFHLTLKGGLSMTFHIYSRTTCSIYAIGDHSQNGLLVGNLPYGVLLCTYVPSHHTGSDAIEQFEQVCGLLRS